MQLMEYGHVTKTTYPTEHLKNLPSSLGGHGCIFQQPHSHHADEDEEEPRLGKKRRKTAAKAAWGLKHFSFLSENFKQKDDNVCFHI